MYIKADLAELDLTSLGKFDVILMDPPWIEYQKRIENISGFVEKEKFNPWTLKEIASLPLDKISSTPTFLFLWCGSDHLLQGRTLFNKWGFKRCEDVVWIKTNKKNKTTTKNTNETSIF
jgi:mRNA (2'-O-methyladenosine-N6-)-methyltransferase